VEPKCEGCRWVLVGKQIFQQVRVEGGLHQDGALGRRCLAGRSRKVGPSTIKVS
jgi:hypothetical protein